MKNHLAVIDLGTNTCNLLIAEYENKNYRIIHQSKEVVKLGKNGIDKNMLTSDALERAITAFRKHLPRIQAYPNIELHSLATSAVRDAQNQKWFQDELLKHTGIPIRIISGEMEADLIFKGVKLAFSQIADHSLVLDIGGGSNEFILSQSGNAIWQQSFPLGMARVIEEIPPSDPITAEEINRIYTYFDSRLTSLWTETSSFRIPALIGCSGAFDTIVDLIDRTDPGERTRIHQEIFLNDFERIFRQLIQSTTAERIAMKGMEPIRVEMIVPAVLFIKLIVEKLKINKIYQTDYALREGFLYERIFS